MFIQKLLKSAIYNLQYLIACIELLNSIRYNHIYINLCLRCLTGFLMRLCVGVYDVT